MACHDPRRARRCAAAESILTLGIYTPRTARVYCNL
ncbi:Bor/Iss family lipoprotein [Aeromonas sp. A-5]